MTNESSLWLCRIGNLVPEDSEVNLTVLTFRADSLQDETSVCFI